MWWARTKFLSTICWANLKNCIQLSAPRKTETPQTIKRVRLFNEHVVHCVPIDMTGKRALSCEKGGGGNNVHLMWRATQQRHHQSLLGHFRKKVTSDGMWAMLGVGTMYTEARGTEICNGDSHMLICPSASTEGYRAYIPWYRRILDTMI